MASSTGDYVNSSCGRKRELQLCEPAIAHGGGQNILIRHRHKWLNILYLLETVQMADRPTAQTRQGGGGIPRARNGTSSVRRNLFQSHLTRRPTPSSSTSAETLRLDTDAQSESSEIVVRDKNGEVELGDPPPPPVDDPDEMAVDARHENESK